MLLDVSSRLLDNTGLKFSSISVLRPVAVLKSVIFRSYKIVLVSHISVSLLTLRAAWKNILEGNRSAVTLKHMDKRQGFNRKLVKKLWGEWKNISVQIFKFWWTFGCSMFLFWCYSTCSVSFPSIFFCFAVFSHTSCPDGPFIFFLKQIRILILRR